jgi:hypothetical protein
MPIGDEYWNSGDISSISVTQLSPTVPAAPVLKGLLMSRNYVMRDAGN